jgi:hypothetical protein
MKRTIRLTESDINKMVMEVVTEMSRINEMEMQGFDDQPKERMTGDNRDSQSGWGTAKTPMVGMNGKNFMDANGNQYRKTANGYKNIATGQFAESVIRKALRESINNVIAESNGHI